MTSDDITPEATDRRLLWHVAAHLSVANTLDDSEKASLLRAYLDSSCTHQWVDYPASPWFQAHRQCAWCHDLDKPAAVAS